MAEKLYKSHCTVSGHGMRCEVAECKKRHKKDVGRLRRRLAKKECRLLTKRSPDAATPWACECDWVNNSDNVICVACGTPRR